MAQRRKKNESFENIKNVTDGKAPDTLGQMDVVMADAVKTNIQNEEHVEDVQDKLKKNASQVTPENPKEQETNVKNAFTAKLVLDESISDFILIEDSDVKIDGRSNKVYDDDGEDDYLDYDMFDFVYGLVTDCWPKPKDPFGRRKYKKFMYIGSDTYKNTADSETKEAANGHAQVASTGDTIEVYHNDASYFNDVAMILDKYEIKYSGPNERRSKNTYWKYSWTIQVPCVSSGYPYMVEDYFETLGLTMEDVMDNDFCTKYRKRQAAMEKENNTYINQSDVDKFVNQAIIAAAQDNSEPLQVHLKRLYATLDQEGLKYQKSKVKKTFMDAFDDDDEEDE